MSQGTQGTCAVASRITLGVSMVHIHCQGKGSPVTPSQSPLKDTAVGASPFAPAQRAGRQAGRGPEDTPL